MRRPVIIGNSEVIAWRMNRFPPRFTWLLTGRNGIVGSVVKSNLDEVVQILAAQVLSFTLEPTTAKHYLHAKRTSPLAIARRANPSRSQSADKLHEMSPAPFDEEAGPN